MTLDDTQAALQSFAKNCLILAEHSGRHKKERGHVHHESIAHLARPRTIFRSNKSALNLSRQRVKDGIRVVQRKCLR